MKTADFGYGNGITTDFGQALAENAKAMKFFDAMAPEDRQKLLARARQAKDFREMKALIDEMVGWEIGHEPYQL